MPSEDIETMKPQKRKSQAPKKYLQATGSAKRPKQSSKGRNKNHPSRIGNSTDCTHTNCAIASTLRAGVPVIVTEDDESAPRRHISTRQQTLTTANLTVSHGPVINIVSEATQHQSSPVDQHQRSQVDQHQRSQVGQHQRSQVVPNQRQTGNIQRLPSTLMQRVQMPVNESTNNDLSVGASAATSNNIGMLTQTGEIAIEQSNVNLNS